MNERCEMVDNQHQLSLRKQCDLLSVHRSGIYYKPRGEKQENLEIMRLMDEHYLKHPTEGVLRMQDFLFAMGFVVNHKRVRRLLRLMGLMAIYPKKNLSKLGLRKYIHPYLLKGMKINRPNQVWAIDITYIPMKNGFMYMTAIIDIYSRYIVGWGISNTLESEASIEVLKQAIKEHGKPEIINSDQGSQFTCEDWVAYLKEQEIQISMDGKGRAIDNIFIERFWRSLKYDHVYIFPASDGLELYQGVKEHIHYYNHSLSHQGIGRRVPAELYQLVA
ncbi:MAG: IS3 family transposase [Bacteroidetes bacterium]|jgi:putative transposase|nr:IS3 family transposase [Bacteroidota bacterium]